MTAVIENIDHISNTENLAYPLSINKGNFIKALKNFRSLIAAKFNYQG